MRRGNQLQKGVSVSGLRVSDKHHQADLWVSVQPLAGKR